jgi:hypothetical protein
MTPKRAVGTAHAEEHHGSFAGVAGYTELNARSVSDPTYRVAALERILERPMTTYTSQRLGRTPYSDFDVARRSTHHLEGAPW